MSINEYEVLVSYSSPDREVARSLVQALRDHDVCVWWDEGDRSDPSKGTITEIVIHLMEPLLLSTKYLVLIATGAAIASDWVPVEISSFLDSKRPVIVWHPGDDDFNPMRYRSDMSLEAFEKVRAMIEHEDVMAHYDLPRSEVSTVGRNIALLIRFYRFIEAKGEKVDRSTASRYWDEFVDQIRTSGQT